MLANCYFPKKLKFAKITPIPKPNKDSSILLFWRLISNLYSISKIFKKILQSKLLKFSRNLKIFENQFGFRGSYSTIHPLAIMQNDINSGLNKHEYTSIISLDPKSAFDTVWIGGLIYKMAKLGINPFLTKIKSFSIFRLIEVLRYVLKTKLPKN